MRTLILAATIAGLLLGGSATAQTSGATYVFLAPAKGIVSAQPVACSGTTESYAGVAGSSFASFSTVVPPGCHRLSFTLTGGAGGLSEWDSSNFSAGGYGASVGGSIVVAPGDAVAVWVGDGGANGYQSYACGAAVPAVGQGGASAYAAINGTIFAVAGGGGGGDCSNYSPRSSQLSAGAPTVFSGQTGGLYNSLAAPSWYSAAVLSPVFTANSLKGSPFKKVPGKASFTWSAN